MDFILQRLKAFAAIAAPLVTTALMQALEQSTGFDIPATWETLILAAVTGAVVHQVPNKPKAPSQ